MFVFHQESYSISAFSRTKIFPDLFDRRYHKRRWTFIWKWTQSFEVASGSFELYKIADDLFNTSGFENGIYWWFWDQSLLRFEIKESVKVRNFLLVLGGSSSEDAPLALMGTASFFYNSERVCNPIRVIKKDKVDSRFPAPKRSTSVVNGSRLIKIKPNHFFILLFYSDL